MVVARTPGTVAAVSLIAGVVYIASCTFIDGCFVRGFNKDSAHLNGLFEPLETPPETAGMLWSHAKMARVRVNRGTNMTSRLALASLLSLRNNVWRDQRVTLRRWSEHDADFQFLWENRSKETQSRTLSVHCTQRGLCTVRIACRAFPRARDILPLSKYIHSQFAEDLTQKPITCFIIAALIGIFVHLRVSQTHFSDVSISYTRVVEHAEVWRVFTAAVSHYEIWHILFNISAAYSVGFLENQLGPAIFVQYIAVLMVGSMALMMAMVRVLSTRANSSALRDQMALGFSAVLFGLVAVACATSPRYCLLPGVCFTTYELPTPWHRPFKFNLAPFVMAGITQCVVRQSSLLGHMSGLLAGFFVPWLPLTPPAVVYACGLWAMHLFQRHAHPANHAWSAAWVTCSAIAGVGCLMTAAFSSVAEMLSATLGLILWCKCTGWPPESANSSVNMVGSASHAHMLRLWATLGFCVECYWLLLLTTATCALRHVLDEPDGSAGPIPTGLGLSASTSILVTTATCMVSCLARLCFLWGRCGLLRAVGAVLESAPRCPCMREWVTDEEQAALLHRSTPSRVAHLTGSADSDIDVDTLQPDHESDEHVGAGLHDGSSIPQLKKMKELDLVRAKRLEFCIKHNDDDAFEYNDYR